MKFTSTVYGATSGSVGGLTYSRNRGGQYTRRRALPSNPATERQGIARENMATAVAAWTNNLTIAQRTAWQSYAAATPFVDALGQQIILSGQQMFIRTSTVRNIMDLTAILDAPTMSGLGNTPQFGGDPVVDASALTTTILATAVDAAVGDVAGVRMSRPVPTSRTPAHEPTRFAGSVAYDAVGFNFSDTAPNPFDVTAGQLVRITIWVAWQDGRVSAEASRDVVVVA
jgi:hypothetical protein